MRTVGNRHGTTFWGVVRTPVKYEMEYAAEQVSVYEVCDGSAYERLSAEPIRSVRTYEKK